MVRRFKGQGIKKQGIIIPPCRYYFTMLPSREIYNYISPENESPGHIDRLNKQNGFFNKLEESILKNGIRYPILVSIGWAPKAIIDRLPQDIQEDFDNTFVCFTKGGSRLWVAQCHNLEVPCIVSDFVGKFFDQNELNEEEITECFKDSSVRVAYGAKGIVIQNLPEIHLKENNV